jgi:type VI secretion system VasD/TssJ family lipoprotein
MKLPLILVLVAFAALAVPGCSVVNRVLGIYSPELPVTVVVDTPFDLNTYGEDGKEHSLMLYFFKVADKVAFESADSAKLRSGRIDTTVVPAEPANKAVKPGQTGTRIELSPMLEKRWTHLGIVAAFREPRGEVKMVVKIPAGAEVKLTLGSNEIVSLQ